MSSPHGSKLSEWVRLLANRLLTDSQRKRIKSWIHRTQSLPRKLLGVDRLIQSQAGEIERLKSKLVLVEGKLNAGLYGLPSDTEYSAKLISNTLLLHRELAQHPSWRELAGISREKEATRISTALGNAGLADFAPRKAFVAGIDSPSALEGVIQSFPTLETLQVSEAEFLVLQEVRAAGFKPEPQLIATDPYTALASHGPGPLNLIASFGRFCRLSGLEQAEFIRLAVDLLSPGGVLYLEVPRLAHPRVANDLFWADPRHLRPYSEGWLRSTLASLPGKTEFVPMDAAQGPDSALSWGVIFRKDRS